MQFSLSAMQYTTQMRLIFFTISVVIYLFIVVFDCDVSSFPNHIHYFLLVVDLSRWAPNIICENAKSKKVEMDMLNSTLCTKIEYYLFQTQVSSGAMQCTT